MGHQSKPPLSASLDFGALSACMMDTLEPVCGIRHDEPDERFVLVQRMMLTSECGIFPSMSQTATSASVACSVCMRDIPILPSRDPAVCICKTAL